MNRPSTLMHYAERSGQDYDIVIEPGQGFGHYWRDLWRHRELFYFLSWRDILVRYKQTAIGIAWGVLRPLITMIILTLVFGSLAKLPSWGVPYAVLVYAAMLPWHFFAGSLTECSNSLVLNAGMITKIYFPRLIIPVSAIIVNLVDFLISFLILLLLMFWYGLLPTWRFVALPIFIVHAVAASFGLGTLLAALNVKYRDFRYVVPFIVQFGLYVSPVGFSSAVVPGNWRLVYSLNPIVGVIDGFRWAILGDNTQFYWPGFSLSLLATVIILVIAIRYFRSAEREFADIV